MKSGQITDPDRLFKNLAELIFDKYTEIGIDLGLKINVLTNELETGEVRMLKGSRKALKMLQLVGSNLSLKTTFPILCLLLLLKRMDIGTVLTSTATLQVISWIYFNKYVYTDRYVLEYNLIIVKEVKGENYGLDNCV